MKPWDDPKSEEKTVLGVAQRQAVLNLRASKSPKDQYSYRMYRLIGYLERTLKITEVPGSDRKQVEKALGILNAVACECDRGAPCGIEAGDPCRDWYAMHNEEVPK